VILHAISCHTRETVHEFFLVMPKHTHKYTLTTMDNIISPIHIYCRIVFGLWGKPKHPEETHADKERTPGSVGAQTEDLPSEPLIETYTDCKWRSQLPSQNLTAVICYFRHADIYPPSPYSQLGWRIGWAESSSSRLLHHIPHD